MTAEARLAEMKVAAEQQISMARGWKTGNDFRAQQLIAALEAVLGLHKEDESKALGGGDFMEIEGYNRALSDVRTRITEALGVTS